MPARKRSPTEPKTNLAKARVEARITQKKLAEWVGISLRQYRRIELHLEDPFEESFDDEERKFQRPSLAFLVNCALALGVPFDKVAPPDWQTTWTQLSSERPIAPFEWEVDEERQNWREE